MFNNTSQQVVEKRENWVYYFIISFFLTLWFFAVLLLSLVLSAMCCLGPSEEPCEKLLAARIAAAVELRAQFFLVVPVIFRESSEESAYKLSQFSWFHLLMDSNHMRMRARSWIHIHIPTFYETQIHIFFIFREEAKCLDVKRWEWSCQAPISLNESINNAAMMLRESPKSWWSCGWVDEYTMKEFHCAMIREKIKRVEKNFFLFFIQSTEKEFKCLFYRLKIKLG